MRKAVCVIAALTCMNCIRSTTQPKIEPPKPAEQVSSADNDSDKHEKPVPTDDEPLPKIGLPVEVDKKSEGKAYVMATIASPQAEGQLPLHQTESMNDIIKIDDDEPKSPCQTLRSHGTMCFTKGVRFWLNDDQIGRVCCDKYIVSTDKEDEMMTVRVRMSVKKEVEPFPFKVLRWAQVVHTDDPTPDIPNEKSSEKSFVDAHDRCKHLFDKSVANTLNRAENIYLSLCRKLRTGEDFSEEERRKYCILPYVDHAPEHDDRFKDDISRPWPDPLLGRSRARWTAELVLFGLTHSDTQQQRVMLRMFTYGFDRVANSHRPSSSRVELESIRAMTDRKQFGANIRAFNSIFSRFEQKYEKYLCYPLLKRRHHDSSAK